MPRNRSVRRRRRIAAAAGSAVLLGVVVGFQQVTGAGGGSPPVIVQPPPAASVLEIRVGPEPRRRVDLSTAYEDGRLDPRRFDALIAEVVRLRWRARDGAATVVYGLRPADVRRAVLRADEPVVRVAARPVSSRIAAPVVAQELRNNCESAALEILLATAGRRVPQLRLQAALEVSGGLDPVGTGASRIWGDPELGYVGRPDGGGVAGGFGVYPPPVRTAAGRFGVELEDMTGRTTRDVFERVRSGRAVMVWIGLSDGPYGEWTSPEGRPVRVNFGEHTVVLAGVTSDGRLRIVNPLQGTRETWSRAEFEPMWRLLGRRALALPA